MNKIRIAQIGTSRYSHGEDIFATLKQAQDTFEVVGFAFPENERAKFPERMTAFETSREMTLEEILNDPDIDAVTVETEEKYLTKYALLAAEHGKHIHMEKPGGTDPEAFEKLISAVKRNNIVFHIGYMYRYNPVISRVIQEARTGEYGKIVSVDAQMSCTHPVAMRTWLKELDGGMMFFLGCHLVDLVLRIKGSPNRIIPLNKSTGTDGIDCTDFGMAALAGQKAEIDLKNIYVRNVRIIGSTLRSRTPEVKAQILENLVKDVFPKVSQGLIKPTIYKVLPITEAEEAHNILYRGENIGKVVLKVR